MAPPAPARRALLAGVLLSLPAPATAAPLAVEAQGVLDRGCVKCHGPLEEKGGLRLDTLDHIRAGGDSGPVVVPGKPDESPLVQVVRAGSDPHMPPKKQLSDADVAKLRDWVAAGAPAPDAPTKKVAATVPSEPTAAIDHFLAEGWRARAVTPAPVCEDRVFVRRVSLDVIGRIPTVAEVDAFVADRSPGKRAALVDRLMATPEAARHFREVWDALLMGRAGRREDRRRDSGWFAFLEAAYAKNRPWHDVIRAMIAARPDRPDDKGAVWFLYERRDEHQQIAEALAPVIYGTRIDCAQCHDHPLAAEIKQGHYWGLVAAFNRSKNAERGGPVAVKESAAGGFINFTNLKKESQPAVVALLNGRVVAEPRHEADAPALYVDPKAAVKVPKFSRRGALADAATTDNPLLARSFVNHTWAILFGRGLVDPPDEMNSKHPASHPELLDWLSADFAAHNHDVRRLTRAILLSRGYQLAAPAGAAALPADAFAAALERPITAEAVARSARVAAGLPPDDDALRRAVAEAFPDAPPRGGRSTVQQAMFLANNELVAGLFRPDASATALAPEEAVRAAFRRALVRDPDADELAKGAAFVRGRADARAALGELLWALATGPEFLTNH